jgi:hypothetical protein
VRCERTFKLLKRKSVLVTKTFTLVISIATKPRMCSEKGIWVQLASNTSSEEFFITPKVAASAVEGQSVTVSADGGSRCRNSFRAITGSFDLTKFGRIDLCAPCVCQRCFSWSYVVICCSARYCIYGCVPIRLAHASASLFCRALQDVGPPQQVDAEPRLRDCSQILPVAAAYRVLATIRCTQQINPLVIASQVFDQLCVH